MHLGMRLRLMVPVSTDPKLSCKARIPYGAGGDQYRHHLAAPAALNRGLTGLRDKRKSEAGPRPADPCLPTPTVVSGPALGATRDAPQPTSSGRRVAWSARRPPLCSGAPGSTHALAHVQRSTCASIGGRRAGAGRAMTTRAHARPRGKWCVDHRAGSSAAYWPTMDRIVALRTGRAHEGKPDRGQLELNHRRSTPRVCRCPGGFGRLAMLSRLARR